MLESESPFVGPSAPEGTGQTPVSSSSLEESVSASSWAVQQANTVTYGCSSLLVGGDELKTGRRTKRSQTDQKTKTWTRQTKARIPSSVGSVAPSSGGKVISEFWSKVDITSCDKAPTSGQKNTANQEGECLFDLLSLNLCKRLKQTSGCCC